MDVLSVRRSDVPCRLASVVAITIALWGCERAREGAPPAGGATASAAGAAAAAGAYEARPTPAPEFGAPVESIPRSRFREYAQRLEFVADPHLADEQPLIYAADRGRPPRVGPIARIEPELGSNTLSERQLHDGRVIARIISDGPYEPLGIRQGIQYLWIDSTRGGWRALMIPANEGPITTLGVSVREYRHLGPAPAASWRFHPGNPSGGTFANGTCSRRCCLACPAGGTCPEFAETSLRVAFDGVEGVLAMRDTVGWR